MSKFCTDAGFLTTVEVGQYFMTKDTVVNTPCQETKVHLNQKVGCEGTPRLDSYWKLQPVAYKVNMEWKLELNL